MTKIKQLLEKYGLEEGSIKDLAIQIDDQSKKVDAQMVKFLTEREKAEDLIKEYDTLLNKLPDSVPASVRRSTKNFLAALKKLHAESNKFKTWSP